MYKQWYLLANIRRVRLSSASEVMVTSKNLAKKRADVTTAYKGAKGITFLF